MPGYLLCYLLYHTILTARLTMEASIVPGYTPFTMLHPLTMPPPLTR